MTFADWLRARGDNINESITDAQLAETFPDKFALFQIEQAADSAGQTVSTNSLIASAIAPDFLPSSGAGGQPAAVGFPLFESTLNLLLNANQQRLASIDQTISIAQLFTELDRVSPTRAADLAVRLGIDPTQDFSFAGEFGSGGPLAAASGGRVGGQIGNQQVSIPGVFSGQELSFLGSNPNVARVVGDIADKFGLPDVFNRSAAALIPTSGSLLGQIS